MQKPKRNKRTAYFIASIAIMLLMILWCKCCCNENPDYSHELICASFERPKSSKTSIEVNISPSLDKDELDELTQVFENLNDKGVYGASDLGNSSNKQYTNLSSLVIQFDFDSSDISLLDSTALSEIIEKYIDYDKLKIHIESYTDSRGSNSYNLQLSDLRSQSVKNVFDGIYKSANKIEIKNFGELQIRNGCVDNVNCSEIKHSENRISIIRFSVTNRLDSSINDKYYSYELQSDLTSIDRNKHIDNVRSTRKLNIYSFTDQLCQNYSLDCPSVIKNQISIIKETLIQQDGVRIIKKDGIGSACYEEALSLNKESVLLSMDSVEDDITNTLGECNSIGVWFLDDETEVVKRAIIQKANDWFENIENKVFYLETKPEFAETAIKIKTKNIGHNQFYSEFGCSAAVLKIFGNDNSTMQLSNISELHNKNVDQFNYYVLHEFGHVLGFHHGFLHDEILPKIDEVLFLMYMIEKYPSLDENEVYDMLEPLGFSVGNFNPTSVMNYTIPPNCLKDTTDIIIEPSSSLTEDDLKAIEEKIYRFLPKTLKT